MAKAEGEEMKRISGLIAELESFKAAYGDLPVVTADPDFMMPDLEFCTPLLHYVKKGIFVDTSHANIDGVQIS